MNLATWVVFVAGLAAALAVIKAVLGDSPLSVVAFFILVMAAHTYLTDVRTWWEALLGALVGSGVYIGYQQLWPADSAQKQVGLGLLTAAIIAVVIVRTAQQRRARAQPSGGGGR